MNRMRRVSMPVVILLLLTAFPVVQPGFAAQRTASVQRGQPVRRPAAKHDAGAVAAILMDVRTGQVLDGRDINRRMAPASTTKMLTTVPPSTPSASWGSFTSMKNRRWA